MYMYVLIFFIYIYIYCLLLNTFQLENVCNVFNRICLFKVRLTSHMRSHDKFLKFTEKCVMRADVLVKKMFTNGKDCLWS